jgi:4-alpha-glucanotransferase
MSFRERGPAAQSGSVLDLAAAVSRFMDERDWARYHAPKNLAAAIATEAAELQEIFLWRDPQDLATDRRTDVEDEVADVAICLLNFCNRTGIDLGRAVHGKLEKAARKYPVERARGKREKYDELGTHAGTARPRRMGVLLHPTSLPGPWGVGDIGPAARAFVRWLDRADVGIWQMLPLGPVDVGGSPYSSPSAFAGDPLLLSVDDLLAEGWLRPEDDCVRELRAAAGARGSARVDWAMVHERKTRVVRLAAQRLLAARGTPAYPVADEGRFQAESHPWLADWARFAARKAVFHGRSWWEWPAEEQPGEAAEREVEVALQFLFARQWARLRQEAHDASVQLMGDVPIFVNEDSADVHAHRDLFRLDGNGRVEEVAGVPPDYFSEYGQRWGNPLYRWEALARDDHRWWAERLRTLLRRVDLVRLDHFRGFAAAWAIPAANDDARAGHWTPGPGLPFFEALRRHLVAWDPERFQGGELPLVAEDLGHITADVDALRGAAGLPGMKVLQFAFTGDPLHPYLPGNFEGRCVVYTGTHDNDTARGWYEQASPQEQDRARRWLARDGNDIAWDLIRAAAASTAELAIAPLQDVLDLGTEARFNVPGMKEGNWGWRLLPGQLELRHADRLAELARVYGRSRGAPR